MSQVGQYRFVKVVESLAGNTGDIVFPQAGNIYILGGTNLNVNGNNTTGALTITLGGSVMTSATADDAGVAAPTAGNMNFYGADNIRSTATASTVTYHLNDSVTLPATISTGLKGVINIGTRSALHAIGTDSIFVGGAGNLLATPTNVTSVGKGSGSALTSGGNLSLLGKDAGSAYTTESNCIAINNIGTAGDANIARYGTYGTGTGQVNLSYIAGNVHASNGLTVDAGDALITAGNLKLPTTSSTAGQILINSVPVFHTYGTRNLFAGAEAGNFTLTVANSKDNVVLGYNALNDIVGTGATQGHSNVAIGSYALSSATESSACIAIGLSAGSAYTTTEHSCIDIGSTGVVSVSNAIRIGGGTGTTLGLQDKCYISGIYGGTSGATAGLVGCDSVDKLYSISGTSGQVLLGGTKPAFSTATYPATVNKGDVLVASADNVIGVVAGATTAGYALVANGATSAPSFQALPPSGIATLAGDSGTATGSTVTIAGGTNITTSATSATVTVDLDNSITLSGDVTAANLKTSTVATNVTINGNTITAGGTDSNVDLNFVTKGTGGWIYDGIAVGWASSQWQMRQSSVQTTDATVTTLTSIPLLEGEMVIINDTINGFQNDFSDALGATVSITAYRPTGGNVTQIGEEIINVNSSSTADVTAGVSVGSQTVIIEVKGVAAETWNWVSTHQYMFTKTNA